MRLARHAPRSLTTTRRVIMAVTMTNGEVSHAPVEVAFPMPRAPHTNIHLQLTHNGPNLVLFLTSAASDSASSAPLGSFVYAMPNVSEKLDTIARLLEEHISCSDILIWPPESISNRDLEHASFHAWRHTGIHNATVQDIGAEDRQAGVCGKFSELCECRHGRHS